ncbi:NAD-dependent epimerase/dehydratase family protein [Streptomyces sp. NPDC059916]|uniref:NAD-dependent epimerase/dehydratase family protein n=1 Tax=Streptomyces sp. NPDC059916 TaxID=3347001 RepID=UPI0036786CC0
MSTEDFTLSFPEDEKVLVTGGSGFVGSHTAVRLLREGHRVRVAVRGPAQEAQVLAALQQAGVDPADLLEFAAADLSADDGWAQAMDGIAHVLHHASPFPPTPPETEDEVVLPARDGALRVIAAARSAGIPRVVMTSSFAAVGYTLTPDNHYTEANWTDPDTPGLPAYHKSKVLAEAAAWDYVRANGGIELAVVNPTGIFGPQLVDRPSGSIGLIKALMAGEMSVVPVWNFGVVDVRDVVDLHLRAMLHPKAGASGSLPTADRRACSSSRISFASTSPPRPTGCPPRNWPSSRYARRRRPSQLCGTPPFWRAGSPTSATRRPAPSSAGSPWTSATPSWQPLRA